MAAKFRRKASSEKSENGAAVVEAAIITPLFVLLILGIIEFGPLFLELGSSKDSVSEGVRLLSISGSSTTADYDTVQSMRNTLKNIGEKLDYIIVYKAASIHANPPQACINAAEAGKTATTLTPVGVFDGGINTLVTPNVAFTPETFDWGKVRLATAPPITACNIYYRRMFTQPKSAWVYDKPAAVAGTAISLDRFYPGSVRIDYQSGPQDFVGLFVQHQYNGPTGLFGARKVTNKSIVRIEPVRANR
jgi:Flp pilus assembly protein TadG